MSLAALLRLRDLRFLAAGTLFNSMGMMGELVVLGWLALELTNSPFLVGAALGCRMLPLASWACPRACSPTAWPARGCC